MNANRQQGAVLVVALLLLLVVTLLGTAVMQGASLDMKMAANNQERQQAFNAAEAGLRVAENYIDTVGFKATDFKTPCSGNKCFNANCTNGFCFAGSYTLTQPAQKDCKLVPTSGTPPAKGPWADTTLNVWTTTTRNVSRSIPGYSNPVQYIIEFRCFIDGLTGGKVVDGTGDVLYRITARGKSDTGRIEAMVQSTYRAVSP